MLLGMSLCDQNMSGLKPANHMNTALDIRQSPDVDFSPELDNVTDPMTIGGATYGEPSATAARSHEAFGARVDDGMRDSNPRDPHHHRILGDDLSA